MSSNIASSSPPSPSAPPFKCMKCNCTFYTQHDFEIHRCEIVKSEYRSWGRKPSTIPKKEKIEEKEIRELSSLIG